MKSKLLLSAIIILSSLHSWSATCRFVNVKVRNDGNSKKILESMSLLKRSGHPDVLFIWHQHAPLVNGLEERVLKWNDKYPIRRVAANINLYVGLGIGDLLQSQVRQVKLIESKILKREISWVAMEASPNEMRSIQGEGRQRYRKLGRIFNRAFPNHGDHVQKLLATAFGPGFHLMMQSKIGPRQRVRSLPVEDNQLKELGVRKAMLFLAWPKDAEKLAQTPVFKSKSEKKKLDWFGKELEKQFERKKTYSQRQMMRIAKKFASHVRNQRKKKVLIDEIAIPHLQNINELNKNFFDRDRFAAKEILKFRGAGVVLRGSAHKKSLEREIKRNCR